MSEHTPGPWDWSYFYEGSPIGVYQTDPVATVALVKVGPNAQANARLIAAAPKLLDALKDLCEEVEECELGNPITLRAARAAIAKAEDI